MAEIKVEILSRCAFRFDEEGFGFGEFRFYYRDGTLILDNEAMSRERIKKYLCVLVDQAQLTQD